jgi:hypothetical protein
MSFHPESGEVSMSWQSLNVIGHPTRDAIHKCLISQRGTVELELEGDELPPFSYPLADMWFVDVQVSGITSADDTMTVDNPDEPMTAVSYTGLIQSSDIPIRLVFFGEVLDHCEVDLIPCDQTQEMGC